MSETERLRDVADSYDDELTEARKTIAHLMGEADRLQAAITRALALCDDYADERGRQGWRPLATATSKVFRRALTVPCAPESPVTPPTPSTPGAEASEGTGEAQEG